MMRFYLVGFLVLLSFDTCAQLCFKFASMDALTPDFSVDWFMSLFGKPWVYGAILGYILTFITWMTLLKHAPVGPSVAASHMELVTVTILSVWLFNEPLNTYKIVGGALILLGVVCLGKAEADEERKKLVEINSLLHDGP